MGNARLLLNGISRAVSRHAHNVEAVCHRINDLTVDINYGDVIVLLVKLLCKSLTDLAAAYYHYIQVTAPFAGCV